MSFDRWRQIPSTFTHFSLRLDDQVSKRIGATFHHAAFVAQHQPLTYDLHVSRNQRHCTPGFGLSMHLRRIIDYDKVERRGIRC